MQASKRPLSAQKLRDQYAELAASLDLLTPGDAARLLGRIKAGDDVAGVLQSKRRERMRWEFLRRVSRWVFGAEDKELDRWAGIDR